MPGANWRSFMPLRTMIFLPGSAASTVLAAITNCPRVIIAATMSANRPGSGRALLVFSEFNNAGILRKLCGVLGTVAQKC